MKKPCGNDKCSCSTAISGHLSYGSGELDEYGFWQFPCETCARNSEQQNPELGKCWPFEHPDHVDEPGADTNP